MTDPKKPAAPVVDEKALEAAFDILWPLQEWNGEEAVCRAASKAAISAYLAALAQQPRTEPAGEAAVTAMTSDATRLAVAKAICAAHGDDWSREGRRNELLPIYGPLADAAIAAVALAHPRPEQVEGEGEPVAWMWIHEDGAPSFVSDIGTKRIWETTMKRVLVPVYARPAPKPAADVVEDVRKAVRSAIVTCHNKGYGVAMSANAEETFVNALLMTALATPKPAADVPAGKIEQWQWADCGHAAWFDGQPPFGTKEQEVTRRTVYLAPTPANAATEKEGGQFECASASVRPEPMTGEPFHDGSIPPLPHRE